MVDLIFVHDVALIAREERAGSPVTLAAELDVALPVAARLASLDVADVDAHTLVEVLAAWERVAAWA